LADLCLTKSVSDRRINGIDCSTFRSDVYSFYNGRHLHLDVESRRRVDQKLDSVGRDNCKTCHLRDEIVSTRWDLEELICTRFIADHTAPESCLFTDQFQNCSANDCSLRVSHSSSQGACCLP